MQTIVQPSAEWRARVEAFFAQEGLRQTTLKALAAIPENLRHGISSIEDADALFGTPPPTVEEIAAFNDRLAPRYDALVLVQYDLEVRVNAWLAEYITTAKPKRIVEAGCGTGLTFAYLLHTISDANLLGYDCSREMLHQAQRRASLHRHPNATIGLWHGSHDSLVDHLPLASVDLLFTKNSFSAGAFGIPCFDEAPSPQMAREDFYERDPAMRSWRKTLNAFARMLHPAGTYIHIAPLADGPVDALVWLAEEVGFTLVTRNPVWFEKRPTPPADFREEYGRELDAIGVPREHHPEAIERRWDWEAMATGALIFKRC